MLGTKTIALHGRLSLAVQVRALWVPSLATAADKVLKNEAEQDEAEDVDPDPELQASKNIFLSARAAVSVTAACSVLFEQTGEKQKAEKVKLTSRSRPEFPLCLQQALEGI